MASNGSGMRSIRSTGGMGWLGGTSGVSGMGWMGGAGMGATLMYFFDPEHGRRRRALMRDKFVHLLRVRRDATDAALRDLQHRARGTLAEARAVIKEGLLREPVIEPVLEGRVCARLGRVVRHAGGIEVHARDGRVTLRGPVLAADRDTVLATVRATRGVRDVIDEMKMHRRAEDIPSLQGSAARPEPLPDILQENWSPATRLLVSACGGAAALTGMTMGGPIGAAMMAGGGIAVARGATSTRLRRLLGIGGERRAIDLHKTINVAAPVEQVYAFWSHFENFPRFMAHVRDIHNLGDGRSHWSVAGPGGTTIHFTAELTRVEPNQTLAWKTERGATVAHAGMVQFRPNAAGGTQCDVLLSYNPPAGAIGHAVATFLGSDPKTALDEDLLRFKSLIEKGRASAPGKAATRDQVETEAAEAVPPTLYRAHRPSQQPEQRGAERGAA